MFWTLYHYFWWEFYVTHGQSFFEVLQEPFHLIRFFSFVVIQAAGVYFCLYYLVPNFLTKGKYLAFLVTVLATIGVMSLLILGGIHLGAVIQGVDVKDVMPYYVKSNFYIIKKDAFPSSLSSMTLGLSIKLGKDWIQLQRRQRELEQEKLQSELQFLKSQFNPHFLFNTINSIFVLIKKNSDLAGESLSKFSELLRYQLYECNEPEIPLSKELSFIQSFLALERLRHDDHVEIKTQFNNTDNSPFFIAPFLLMPFIENAFKHFNPSKDTENWVHIDCSLDGSDFYFHISNSWPPEHRSSNDAVQYNGLGLKNVQRRLELIYPKGHELLIDKSKDAYKVTLRISLNSSPIETLNPKTI